LTLPGGLQKDTILIISVKLSLLARLHWAVGRLFAFYCGFTLATYRSDHHFIFKQDLHSMHRDGSMTDDTVVARTFKS
jgi:hypothetical protein